MVVATIFLCLWKVRQKQAENTFEQLVATAEAASDPRDAVTIYETYIGTHPDNSISRKARKKLTDSQERVVEHDYSVVIAAADAEGDEYEAAEHILQAYLETQPPSPYREKAEQRLAQLPALCEARNFRLIQEQFPEDTTDLEGRRAALEDFIRAHPRGSHAEAAEKAIVLIVDAIDERAFVEVEAKASSLKSAQRYADAIALIEFEMDNIASPKRKSTLNELRQQIQAAGEADTASEILALSTSSTDERNHAISECRLFLLCSPTSNQAPKIQVLLNTLTDQRRDDEWEILQAALKTKANDPAHCISLIDRFSRRWPEWEPEDLAKLAIAHHVALFKQTSAKINVIERGVLVRKDGTEINGRIEKVRSSWRITELSTGEKSPLYPQDSTKGIRLEPGPEFYDDVTDKIDALDSTNPNQDDIVSIVKLAETNGLKRLGTLARCLLLSVCPDDAASKRILTVSGYQQLHGRWANPESCSAPERIQEILEYYQEEIIKNVREVVSHLQLHFTYSELGEEYKVPVECFASYKRVQIIDASRDGRTLTGNAQIEFSINLRQMGVRGDSDDQAKEIEALIHRQRRNLKCVVDFEIEEKLYNAIGAEITGNGASGWRLKSIATGGPAEKAWLELNDELLAIDEVPPGPQLTLDDVQNRLATPSIAAIDLQLRRRDKTFTVKLQPERPATTVVSARYRIRHNIGQDGAMQEGAWINLPSVEW